MKISQEAREAAAGYLLVDDVANESDIRKFRQGFRDADELVQAMQSLINSTMERASRVALARANHAQRLIEDGDVTDARVAFMMCAELIEKEIRQLIEE